MRQSQPAISVSNGSLGFGEPSGRDQAVPRGRVAPQNASQYNQAEQAQGNRQPAAGRRPTPVALVTHDGVDLFDGCNGGLGDRLLGCGLSGLLKKGARRGQVASLLLVDAGSPVDASAQLARLEAAGNLTVRRLVLVHSLRRLGHFSLVE